MTDPAEKPAIARNVLTNAALIRLTDWARQNVEACQTLSNKTLATMAGETLTLHLTAANIASALEAVNITKVKPKAPPSLEERIAELDTTVGTQGLHIAALESNLTRAIQLIEKGILDIGARSIVSTPANSACGISFSLDLPEPTAIQAIATDGPITITPPMLASGTIYNIGIDLPKDMPSGTVCPVPDLQKLAINAANSEKLKASLGPESQTLHGPPNLDLAAAEVKAEREREQEPDDSPVPLTPIHGMTYAAYGAAAAIAGEP